MPYVCPAEGKPIKGSVPCVVTMNTIIVDVDVDPLMRAKLGGRSTKCPWKGVVEGKASGNLFFRPLTPRY